MPLPPDTVTSLERALGNLGPQIEQKLQLAPWGPGEISRVYSNEGPQSFVIKGIAENPVTIKTTGAVSTVSGTDLSNVEAFVEALWKEVNNRTPFQIGL